MSTKTAVKVTKQLARKFLSIIDHPDGLVKGLGKPEPGKFCIEAALCYTLGLPHRDDPPCVGRAVRAFKVQLNDCNWSSNQARARGMRRLGIAQLGSNEIDQMAFGKLMFLRGTQKLLPFVFREIAKIKTGEHRACLNKHADLCENVTSFSEAKQACKDASACAYACAYAYASAYAYTYACAYAYTYAYADFNDAKLYEEDRLLRVTAEVGVECLQELKSPGTKWLDICE